MKMIMEIFTWWNRQTLGTRVWSYFNGVLVGEDNCGNKYFSNKDDSKRWVIYRDEVEATTVNSEWNNWLRFTSAEKPGNVAQYDWQIEHKQNQTGTPNSYSPQTIFDKTKHKKKIDYDKWSP